MENNKDRELQEPVAGVQEADTADLALQGGKAGKALSEVEMRRAQLEETQRSVGTGPLISARRSHESGGQTSHFPARQVYDAGAFHCHY